MIDCWLNESIVLRRDLCEQGEFILLDYTVMIKLRLLFSL